MADIKNASFGSLSSKEWLVTNGIGGYASGTVSCANTRRYHGLLCASFNPPTERKVIVSKFVETVHHRGGSFEIDSNQYVGAIHPDGFEKIRSFERMPFPKWEFSSEDIVISKAIFMIYGRNTTVVEYDNLSKKSISIDIVPLIVVRDYHHLRKETLGVEYSLTEKDGKLKCFFNGNNTPFYLFFENGSFTQKGDWYRNFELERERDRGLDDNEDAYTVGTIRFELKPGDKRFVIVSTEEHLPDGPPEVWKRHEEIRLQSLIPDVNDLFLQDLIVSGDQFLVWRLSSKSHTIIAGYHWFTDWGRDTMIAMRGLVIATGKKQITESIILTFLSYLKDGLIPNRFPDNGEEPEYNTIDATLWLFIVLHEYYTKFEDLQFIEKVFPSLTSILDCHYAGTKYNIHVTKEGLLYGGEEGVQLTWMDAKVGDHVVTPRQGCAVEINALWYNALKIYSTFSKMLGKEYESIEKKADLTKQAFQKYFLNQIGYLNDVVIPDQLADDAIRPNQIYAVSLPFSPLTEEHCRRVTRIVEEHLYTGYGLRSLSPAHPDFKGIYKGDQWERDHAYHQGTVWSHLWGEYALAYLKVNNYSANARKIIGQKAEALKHHFYNENGLYAISEIFDGENPHNGKGCIQQAWSIGMTIKALIASQED